MGPSKRYDRDTSTGSAHTDAHLDVPHDVSVMQLAGAIVM